MTLVTDETAAFSQEMMHAAQAERADVRPRDPHHGRTDLGTAGWPDGGGLISEG